MKLIDLILMQSFLYAIILGVYIDLSLEIWPSTAWLCYGRMNMMARELGRRKERNFRHEVSIQLAKRQSFTVFCNGWKTKKIKTTENQPVSLECHRNGIELWLYHFVVRTYWSAAMTWDWQLCSGLYLLPTWIMSPFIYFLIAN